MANNVARKYILIPNYAPLYAMQKWEHKRRAMEAKHEYRQAKERKKIGNKGEQQEADRR